MTHQVIEVIVQPNGETKVQSRGFVGSSCKLASQFLETALGVKSSEQLTRESHQTTESSQSLRQTRRLVMTTPRRRVLRSSAIADEIDRRHLAAQRRAETKLAQARSALERWLPRLKRALTAVSKHQQEVARLEKLVAAWQRS